ncbi:hypothetical protein NUW58_g1241 [Xylaria curta]|uniref:Uncharacterized protein n=1 Tax=Xylaria curta TaxID=42375 RepID=A0ACC1PMJ4_9PEZI|nr:hypothetical protein NUW58_g1241 [Xylaria curta]
MDPTPRNISTFMFPTAVCTPNPPAKPCLPQLNWSESSLNPKNRIDSLEPLPKSEWTIHGADLAGTRWFAIPNFAVGKPPLRIDVHIPEFFDVPGYLRDALIPNSPMFGELEAAVHSNVAVHILRALQCWSTRNKDIEKEYLELPFGSRIVLENMSCDVRQISIQFVPIYDIERQWLSVKALQDMWKLPNDAFPAVIDFDKLQFRQQLHDTITVVSLAVHRGRQFIFKSLMNDLKYFYHELKVLITMKPHTNIISRPIYIVTKRCGFGGKRGVCGMILEYYPKGTLRKWLKDSQHTVGPNQHAAQVSWAKQIVSALIHIQEHGSGFYTNLKLDNIVMADSHISHIPKIVMIDFEQRLGSPAWTPPEIHWMTFLSDLIHHNPRSSTSQRYQDLFKRHGIEAADTGKATRYTNPEAGYCFPWSILPHRQREAAQVFMLGKLLWCIFENASLLSSYIGINSFRDNYSEKLFPDFETTPIALRECILRCTAGSWESRERTPPLAARGRKIVLRNSLGQTGGDSLGEIQTAIRRWWRQQIADAEAFIEHRSSGILDVDYWKMRPRLIDVLAVLEKMET